MAFPSVPAAPEMTAVLAVEEILFVYWCTLGMHQPTKRN